MKKKILATILLIACAIISFEIKAQKKVEQILAEKAFNINENADLQIDHKYGEVVLKNHEENVISIKVTAVYSSGKPEKAESVFEKIDLQIRGDEFKVAIKSDFNQKIVGNDNSLIINMLIYLPETINLTLNQMFGKSEIEKISGETSISHRYGDLIINTLKNEKNDLKIEFGSAKIDFIRSGKIKTSYSTVTIKSATQIQLTSEYSTLILNDVSALQAQHEGGSMKIGSVDYMDINSKFSEISINSLSSQLLADVEYGAIAVDQISSSFSAIDLKNNFGSGKLVFEDSAEFSLQADMNFCKLKYPENQVTISENISSAMRSSIKGVYGKNPKPESTVVFSSNYGGVTILTKQIQTNY
jgi:hypothetical protein